MATPNLTPKMFGVSDLRIYQMLTDVQGSAPTYDTVGIDMPGVSSITMSNDAKVVEGKGDERILEIEFDDQSSKIDFEMLYIPLNAMALVNGGVVDTTTDTNAATYYGPAPTDLGSYFKIEALTKSTGEKIVIYKNKGRLYPSGLKGSQFNNPAYVGTAIHTTGNIGVAPRRFGLVQSNYGLVLGGAYQVDTATIVGTITTAGNATVTVTAVGVTGSPLAITVAVALADSAAVVAQKIREALLANTAVTAIFNVSGTGVYVVLTKKLPQANDATVNIAYTNGTCAGLTANANSIHTQAGVSP